MALRGLLPLITNRPEFRRLRERLAPAAAAPVLSGVTEAARPYLIAALATTQETPLIYVVRENERVTQMADALGAVLGRETTVLPWIDRDALPYERLMPDPETVQTRMRALTALARREPIIVVCSSRALAVPQVTEAGERLAGVLVGVRVRADLDHRAQPRYPRGGRCQAEGWCRCPQAVCSL